MKVILTYELELEDDTPLLQIETIVNAGYETIIDHQGVSKVEYLFPEIDLSDREPCDA